MSVPAWKQAILERKRQQEEVEKKKQLQKEQYYASLPPWKRAMLKKKGSTSDLNEEHPPCPLIKPKNDLIPAWKQAFRSRKDSFEKEKQIQNEVENDRIPAWKQAVRSRKESFEKEKQVQNEVENGDHIPAWKQAVRSRKQSFEKEKQVQNEVENGDHIPAWKQAVRSRKQSFEKEKQVQNEVENGDHIPAWKQAVRSRKESFEKEKKQMQNEVVTAKSTGYINKEPSTKSVEKKGIAHNLRGKFEQQSTTQTFKKSEEKPVESEDRKQFPDTKETASQKEEESSKPQSEMEDERTNKIPTETPVVLQKLKGQFEQNEGSGRSRRPSQIKQAQSVFDVDDEKLKTMPKWKQDLILRKQQQQKTTETPPSPVSKTTPQRVSPITDHKKIKSDVAAKENNQSPVAKSPPVSVTKSSSPVSQNAFTYASSHTEMDKLEVVNSSDKKEDSPMLLHKEGKELKPPAFKIKGKWAEIAEDDPEFKNLPAWKQNLILRRKNDFKNRTALPKVEKEEKPKQEPLPAPLWTPTRSVTIREIPKGPEKTEDTNPLLDMRKNLKKVKKPISQTDVTIVPGRKNRKGDSPFGVQLGNRNEEEESLSPLKDNSNKPKRKLRRVSWSDTDLSKSLTIEFIYPKYSYEDYFDIDQSRKEANSEKPVEEVDSSELATPLHPWLSPPPPNSNTVPNSTASHGSNMSSDFGKPTSFSGMSSVGLGSLDSFMTAYTGSTTNSYSSSSNSTSNQQKEDVVNHEEKPNETEQYDENTAALLW